MSTSSSFDFTREALLELLRAGPRAVPDLAEELEVSGTAIRKHLDQLRLDRLVEEVGVRRGRGRPAVLYGLTEKGEARFRRDRAEILEAVLAAVHAGGRPAASQRILRDAGRRLARRMMAEEKVTGEARRWDDPVDRALHFLHEIGGRDSLRHSEEGGVEILGFTCPLGEYVEPYPQTCHFVAGFTEEVLGRSVTPCCSRDAGERDPDTPVCILAADAAAPQA